MSVSGCRIDHDNISRRNCFNHAAFFLIMFTNSNENVFINQFANSKKDQLWNYDYYGTTLNDDKRFNLAVEFKYSKSI